MRRPPSGAPLVPTGAPVRPARLLAALRCDARLQRRHGFYGAAGFVAAVLVLGLSRLPADAADLGGLRWLVPAVVAAHLTLGTFYFVAGLVLLEKGEGTLEAVVVTPLRAGEYLAAKVMTLTLLAVVENVVVVVAFTGWGLGAGVLPLALGIALAAAVLVLLGFVAVARHDSVNAYLAPSVGYGGLATLPVFAWLAGWDRWLLYLHPLQGPLLLMRGAFDPLPAGQLVYSLLYPVLWIALAGAWSRRAFRRLVVAPAGAP